MPATFEPIATTTLGSAASSITFSSIPNTYTDLRLVFVPIPAAGNAPRMRFNSDSGTNYSVTEITANGSIVESLAGTNSNYLYPTKGNDLVINQIYLITMDIFSYAGSTNKTSLIEVSGDRNGAGYVRRSVHLWRSTSAINEILIDLSGSNYATGSTATLYGILKA